jgi:hypothetical protein
MSLRTTIVALVVPALFFAACADETVDDQNSNTDETQNSSGDETAPDDGNGGAPAAGGGAPADDGCPHEGPPLFDPEDFVACPSYVCEQGAHCVPNAAVPDDVVDFLSNCNADSKCVPDPFIETLGKLLLETCTAVMGLEGRCLSGCIPLVAEKADLLDQSTCQAGDLCVPCFDPLSGEDTSACHLTCDPGPVEPPPEALPSCCPNNDGTCVPSDLVPAEFADSLAQDSCPDAAQLCVPNENLDPSFDPIPCEPDVLLQFLGVGDGVCQPDCLDAVKGLGQGSCPAGYTCAPCHASGMSTGACDDPW